MLEGTLQTNDPTGSITNSITADLKFPDFHFIFRDTREGCQVFQIINGEELKIGQSTKKRKGFLGLSTVETVRFEIGDREIGLESGALSKWIHFQGQRIKFMMQVNQEDPEEPSAGEEVDDDADKPKEKIQLKEWRTFSLGESSIEHHDYQSHFQIFAPNEEDGILIAFIAFRFWASQFEQSAAVSIGVG